MYKRLPPLNALKVFESAARHLSFTKAADELFVTQAAVSHQIKLLEEFLGTALFIRKNRALALTEQGSAYFYDINIILRRLVEVTQKLRHDQQGLALTIKVPQTFGLAWLVPQLSEFNRLYPDIEVNIQGFDYDESDILADADVAIFYGKGDWKGLKSQRLLEERLSIFASPKLLQQKPLNQLADLAQHNLLHIHTRENWQRMIAYLKLDGINLHHGAIFSHTFMALQAALHGQGVVLANKILAQQYINDGALTEVFSTDVVDPKSFYVVYHPNYSDKMQTVSFINWIVEHIQQHH
ncbi:transcriptional regulator GcvA [Testudinibacter aquarius]|uniref:LysR family glycine cleavage system transcriptional activator n=1 Tax=Testudinibacter aquarius TaxID=1524974 RepID=A0A4R3Y2K4_9PAST|nr:transcriptional regulator GcvA [Testudinibacter aquarius]TNG92605.1 transcriptional regulator GcvA [Pasteurellaceae bacterium USgator41]TNG93961.1 transcriptional regulator GcvA [Pasteurellaceae bacterium UScroc12]TNH00757.1 transcriptional regulator GcvA [Pasteurellaceae bacterium USgator11]TNH01279.1 transcriptional regulator GcvA [Pasteurellaceae bacterium UScroc31]KAE9526406.1 transcriptional regulator [Testudinibacter aquarius]